METPSGLLLSGEWVDRFYSYVIVVGDCQLWTGYKDKNGYGKYGSTSNGRSLPFRFTGEYRTHRIAWVLNFGPVPDELYVLHTCDVRNCVNHKHLFLGTNEENTEDRCKKGRSAKGEQGGTAKFKTNDVILIRSVTNRTNAELHKLAKQFGVTYVAVREVYKRRVWRHVG